MIQSIDIEWYEWQTARNTWKPEWISSVKLSTYGIDTAKLKNYCDRSQYYHAIEFNISGTIKYWFARKSLQSMILDSGANWRAYQGWEQKLFG